jgi:predicted transporter
LLAAISLSVWVYGNSIEHGDMSNAGLQIFGALGTVFFTFIYVATMIFKLIANIRKKKLN